MATAVAIAIRKQAALDRLVASLDALNAGRVALPDQPTQAHPDMREVRLLEWIGDALDAMAAGPATPVADDAEAEPEPEAKPSAKKGKAA